ncbi:MAG: phosphoglycerate mutase family protein [Anaerolineaceae bacterium]|nr:phosphoglycerate mutase family protein [Anaerolineaceae bacterium]
MQLYFIRHAQSINNEYWLKTKSSVDREPDPELSETGQQQKDYLAAYLSRSNDGKPSTRRDPHNQIGFGITHLYTSLMVRAVETGSAISKASGIPLTAWVDLHETGGVVEGDGDGDGYLGLPGNPRSFFEDRYPELYLADNFGEEGWWNRPWEAEEEKTPRAKQVLDRLNDCHAGTEDRVAVITHGAFYNRMMRVLLGIPDESNLWIAIFNTAITRLDFKRDMFDDKKTVVIVDYLNRVDFLPDELVTP